MYDIDVVCIEKRDNVNLLLIYLAFIHKVLIKIGISKHSKFMLI
jgi:hypothetical protein